MASQDVAINVALNGGSKIDQIINKAAQLEGIINGINKTPLDLNIQKAISEFDKFDTNLKAIKAGISTQQKALDQAAGAIDKYTEKIVSTQRQLSNLSPNTKKYNEVLARQEDAIKSLAKAKGDLSSIEKKLAADEERLPGVQKAAGRAKAAKIATEAISALADEYLRLGAAQEKGTKGQILKNQSQSTIARLSAQAEALKLVADNSEIASSQFNRFAIASQVASQKVYEGRQKKLNALAFGLSQSAPNVNVGTGGQSSIAAARQTIDSVIGSFGGVVKSEAALSSYIERLRSLQSLVPYLSEEYGRLERAIGDVSAEMESLQRMTQLRGAVSKIQPQAGLASLLPSQSVKSAGEQAKYLQKRNDYQERLLGVEERISQASLNTLQKTELRTRLDKALGLLAENRLDDAKRETIELEKQRMSLERMNRAQKPLTVGALGTGFSPISGETPGGEVIAGSPAAKLAEAKANRESTQAAVALAQQKQKAVEQEAEELRKGTQAATALGKQKLKALEDEAELLRKETSNAVALAQQKMREEEKAVTDAWKMRGGPALPLGFTEAGRVQQRGGTYRTGEFSPIGGNRRFENIKASGAIVEQSLINLQNKGVEGVDVTEQLKNLQKALNAAKEEGFDISIKTLDALNDQVVSAGRFAQLQNKVLAGQSKSGKTKAAGSGLQAALEQLKEARGASKAFLGDLNPAEAIDKIVRQFGTKKDIGAGVGTNVASTLASEIKAGTSKANAAGKYLGDAVENGLNEALEINSPSEVAIRAGKFVVQGLVNALKGGKVAIKNAASDLVSGILSELPSVKQELESLQISTRPSGSSTRFGQRASFPAQIDTAYIASLLGTPLTPGRPSPAGIFSAAAPRVGAPGSSFPFQSYNLNTTQFPTDAAAQLSESRNRGTDANRVLSEAIREYRAAVNNFWDGEDSQFEAIKKIVVSSTRLASAQLARRFQQTKDLTFDQQFQQIVREARSAIAGGSSATRNLGISSLSGIRSLPQGGIAGLLPAAGDSINNKFEDRIRQAFERSAQRGAAVFAEDSVSRFEREVASGFGAGGRFLPPSPPVPPGGGGAAGAGDFNRRLAEAVQQGPQALLGLEELRQPARASINELNALSGVLTELRSVLDPTIEGFDRLDNQLRETIGTIGRQLERRDPDADFLTRRVGPRGGRAISEGLIGGAFPLLFGQGAGASLGGLLGGAAGGFAGGGLGFGLSLIGTALGTTFDTFVQSAKDLASALDKPVENFDQLKSAAFFSSKELEKSIQRLIDFGDKASASAAIQEEAIKKIGINGVKDLAYLGSEADRLGRAWGELGQQMQALIAGPLASFISVINQVAGPMVQAGRVGALRGGLSGAQKQKFDAELNRAATRGNYRPTGQMSSAAVEALVRFEPEKVQAILDKWQPLAVKGKIKITEKERLESEINALQKQFEAIEIGKKITDQVRQAARQQEDLDQQRANLVRSYEENIAGIRQKVEDQVASKRFTILQKENELLDLQGQSRIRQLQIENQAIIALAGAGQRPEVEEFAKRAASIVAQFTEQQLSAAEEEAKIKRDAALEARTLDFEAAVFKANIEKEVSRLNIETARQVAEINNQVKKTNEEYDRNRFTLEKRIAEIQLQQALSSAQEQIAAVEKQLQLTDKKNPEVAQNIKYFNNLLQVYRAQENVIKSAQTNISGILAPGKLRGVGAVGGGNVSTSALDAELKNEGAALDAIRAEQLRQIDFTKTENINNFKTDIDQIIKQASAPLDQLERDSTSQLERQLDYIRLINTGLTQNQAERAIEVRQAAQLADLSYEAAINELYRARNQKGVSEATQKIIDTEIAKLEIARTQVGDSVPGRIATAVDAEKGKKILDFIVQAKAELNDLDSVATRVSQSISDAIGNSITNGINGLIEGTTTAEQVFADFLKNIGQILIQEGAKIIATYIAIGIAKAFAGLAGNSGGGGGGNAPAAPGVNVSPTAPMIQPIPVVGLPAAKGAYFSNGVAAFANGGIVNSPTLFQFADGGVTQPGVMGEAGPEAIMPLQRDGNGRLGVKATGVVEALAAARGALSDGQAKSAGDPFAENRQALGGISSVERERNVERIISSGASSTEIKYSRVGSGDLPFVTEEDMLQATRVAAQEGAKLGQQRTLAALKNNPGARRTIGI